jgi:hypothetical protein
MFYLYFYLTNFVNGDAPEMLNQVTLKFLAFVLNIWVSSLDIQRIVGPNKLRY